MNGYRPVSTKVVRVDYGQSDATIVNRSEVAEHVANLISTIRNLSETADLVYLTYLLDMAREEALQMKEQNTSGK